MVVRFNLSQLKARSTVILILGIKIYIYKGPKLYTSVAREETRKTRVNRQSSSATLTRSYLKNFRFVSSRSLYQYLLLNSQGQIFLLLSSIRVTNYYHKSSILQCLSNFDNETPSGRYWVLSSMFE